MNILSRLNPIRPLRNINWTTNQHGERSWKKISGLSAAAVFAAVTAWSGTYVNSKRQVSLEVTFGKIDKAVRDAGIQFKTPYLTSRYPYSLARQTIEIGESTTLRTSDDVRLTNPFTVEFQIDQSADIENLYYQLQGSGDDISDVIEKLAKDVTVRVFEALQVNNLAEKGFTDQLKKDIKDTLQEELTAKGWPVTIIDVLSDGFKLQPESEAVLTKIIDIRQEQARLALRKVNANDAKEVLRTEAEAYIEYVKVLSAAGLPEIDIRCAIHDKMALDSGKIMEPFAQVCGEGSATMGSDIAVAVDPDKITTKVENAPAAAAD